MKKRTISLLLLLFSAVSTFAQLEGNPANWCRNGFFPRESEDYSIGVINAKKGEKVYFYGDDDDCPNGKDCRSKAYLIEGNEVIVSRKFGNWACSWYQPRKGSETVGWIPIGNLVFNSSVRGNSDIIGKWGFYDNEIEIKRTKDQGLFKVLGTAFWKGTGDNVHTGELDGTAIRKENKLLFGEDDNSDYACKVRLLLISKYLIVRDNLNCGGANVTFSGVYTKTIR